MQTVDFARSFLYFRNDHLKKLAPTASHKPPSTLNNARILLDCVCEITDNETSRRKLSWSAQAVRPRLSA